MEKQNAVYTITENQSPEEARREHVMLVARNPGVKYVSPPYIKPARRGVFLPTLQRETLARVCYRLSVIVIICPFTEYNKIVRQSLAAVAAVFAQLFV